MKPEIENLLKRLAVGNVCSEHEYIDDNKPDADVAAWFDCVVDNGICLHTDDALPYVYFTVCEQYENTALCTALVDSYTFACEVWRIAEKRLTTDGV